MNPALIGYLLGTTAIAAGVMAVMLALRRIPGMRERPRLTHSLAVLVGCGVAALGATDTIGVAMSVIAGYFVFLLGFWSYRRSTKAPPSGWVRLGAVCTGVLTLPLVALALTTDDANVALLSAISLVAATGLMWLAGFAVRWIWRGFRGSENAG